MLIYQVPLHPARIAKNILVEQGFKFNNSEKLWKVSRYFKTAYFPEDFMHEHQALNCNIAYNLVKLLPHTTMEFWLERQRLYEYHVTNRLKRK